ncbi:MAG TPA: YvcK family protein [Candidatus Woesearchaeota archaeon]|nr:MAG: hypothetical protein DRJ25_01705 [Candidatus Woesearchaeota archaeon]HDD70589.1 YvcK family protein [Candidatus Woesearchaeota archaeon]
MKRIVVVGGGTGTFTVLHGLKKYDIKLSAVVSMADDGGSTGILRSEFGILPVGDVRRCLLALADNTGMLNKLFTYRFGEQLSGHSFGNLFLTALKEITGSMETAIQEAERILKTRGHVLPVTFDDIRLFAELENGEIIKGETNIDIPKHDAEIRIKRVFLKPQAYAYHKAIEALNKADVIVIGPGDLYTSIIPNLLVEGVAKAICNSKAKKIYVSNLMTKNGETNNFRVQDFYNKIVEYLGKACIDYVIYNSNSIPEDLLKKYAEQKQYPVKFDASVETKGKVKFIADNFVNITDIARHDSEKLARKIMELSSE